MPLAHADRGYGIGTTVDKNITDAALWTPVNSVSHTVAADSTEDCLVVAGADVHKAVASTEKTYQFTLVKSSTSQNLPVPANDTATERSLNFVNNNGVNDINNQPVVVNAVFTGLTATNGLGGTGQHIFNFIAKKGNATNPTITILDNNMSVLCTKR